MGLKRFLLGSLIFTCLDYADRERLEPLNKPYSAVVVSGNPLSHFLVHVIIVNSSTEIINQFLKWIMSNNELPNKCDFCGLKQTFSPEPVNFFGDLHKLYDKKIIKQKFNRAIHVDIGVNNNDRTEFCLIGHPAWGVNNKEKKCKNWQLDIGLPKSDTLSINLSLEMKNMAKKANRIAILAVCLGILSIGLTVLPQISIFKPSNTPQQVKQRMETITQSPFTRKPPMRRP